MSGEKEPGSLPPTTDPLAVCFGLGEHALARATVDGVERYRSATGETLTRRHERTRQHDGGGTADPFDRWVDRQLRTLYGPVVDEPMPPRLRAILEEAGRAVDDTAGSSGAPGGQGEADGSGKDHER